MDAILQLPPTLPPHDAAILQPVAHRTVAEWPEGTFVENLVARANGDVIVSVLSEARLDRVSADGAVAVLHQFAAPPTGIAEMDEALYVAMGEPGAGEAVLWRVDAQSGAAEPWMAIAGSQFANGVTPFDHQSLLVADSWRGRLLLVDLAAKSTSVWLEDERLTRAPGLDFLPGANGVKRYRDTVTISSNGRALLLQADVKADGVAGVLSVRAERLRVDDFAFDRDGDLYLTTHIGHTLDRLRPGGERVSLAGPEQGMAGSTACAFGRTPTDRTALYVSTTGGIITPPGGRLQPAKLVRLEVGREGWPLDPPARWPSSPPSTPRIGWPGPN